ncbi:COP9 complex subunit 7a [Striga asiatica]|uniref:COP9 complex subunit 7a n=1 Tax=Striga asiatica TaxID=4170 RepID=A0A5A7P2T4_STRAF|nr:COP9 complex subunit 7a [Striga asiatica]
MAGQVRFCEMLMTENCKVKLAQSYLFALLKSREKRRLDFYEFSTIANRFPQLVSEQVMKLKQLTVLTLVDTNKSSGKSYDVLCSRAHRACSGTGGKHNFNKESTKSDFRDPC